MAPGHGEDDVHAAGEPHRPGETNNIRSSEEHESPTEHDESDADTASLHDDNSQDGEVDEKSRHSGDETEEHHDPEPEGPEGLNTGVMTDSIVPPVLSRSHSRASSARSRPLTIVPRAKRRGLFARFAVIPEVERPYDYSRKTKWTITAIVALAAAGGPIGSNLMYRTYSRIVISTTRRCDIPRGRGLTYGIAALSDIAKDLHTTETIVNMTVAFYMLSMSIFPLWW